VRKAHKGEVIATASCAPCPGRAHQLQFESETAMRYQIQEMLRIEKIFEEEGIQEIEAYAPLVPDGSNWKATMMIEYPTSTSASANWRGYRRRGPHVRRGRGPRPRAMPIADEDLDRENDEKTSAVHFVRFEFTPRCAQARRRRGRRWKLGCGPPQLSGRSGDRAGDLASLGGDFR
jgi:hypothetical protein